MLPPAAHHETGPTGPVDCSEVAAHAWYLASSSPTCREISRRAWRSAEHRGRGGHGSSRYRRGLATTTVAQASTVVKPGLKPVNRVNAFYPTPKGGGVYGVSSNGGPKTHESPRRGGGVTTTSGACREEKEEQPIVSCAGAKNRRRRMGNTTGGGTVGRACPGFKDSTRVVRRARRLGGTP
jgi:hypothetical protein